MKPEPFQVSKRIAFCYGHRLIKHKGQCAYLHGHNAVAEIHCSARQLNDNQMVVDFEDIKSAVKNWIDGHLDHRMILNAEDPFVPILEKAKEPFFKISGDPTAEMLAQLIFEQAKAQKLPILSVTLWETPTSSATYQT